jgi:PAS domain S-box-containing protein
MYNGGIISSASTDSLLADVKKKPGEWQLALVFFNGIILTIVIFITLLVYIDKARNSYLQKTTNYFISDITEKLENVVRNFELISNANDPLSMFDNENYNKYIQAGAHLIQDGLSETWRTNYLYEQDLINTSIVAQLVTMVDEGESNHKHFFMSDGEVLYLAIINKEGSDVYIGLINDSIFSNLLEEQRYDAIERFQLVDPINQNMIINHDKASLNENNSGSDIFLNILSIKVFDKSFNATLGISEKNFMFLGDKLPFIILLLGASITVIGTLFIRNNQNQSSKIQQMNIALEDKNKALEQKIKDVETVSSALKQSEQEYKAVVNTVEDVLFELDETGRIIFLNRAWEKLTGTAAEDAYDIELFKYIHPNESEKARLKFFEFLKTDKPTRFSSSIALKSNGYRTVDIILSTSRKTSDKSAVEYVIGTIIDMEDKQRAEKALNEAEKRYRKIVDNAVGGLYQIDLDGHVVSANPAFLNVLGYEDEYDMEVNNFSYWSIYMNKNDQRTFQHEVSNNSFLRNREIQVYNKNKEVIWINENAQAIRDRDGQVLYYEGSIEDITQRKNAEMELIEAKLNSDMASRAKSEFLANMSHELRTPLNAIIGFSEIIKGEALGPIEQKAYVEYASDIYSSGSHLLTVINEILGISKIEGGQRNLNESVVNLGAVTQTCIDLMASKIEKNNIQINQMTISGAPEIIAEELAFKQIIMNILSNAIKFTPAGGSITITTDYDGHDLRYSVTDTGIGIKESDIPKALSPFGQINNELS